MSEPVRECMVFVCTIWSFDDMALGEQVILSDKKQ